MKKYCLIVKTETYSGITLMVEDDFDEDFDSPILKGVLKDFPVESRRSIIKSEEIDIINEGNDIAQHHRRSDRVAGTLSACMHLLCFVYLLCCEKITRCPFIYLFGFNSLEIHTCY